MKKLIVLLICVAAGCGGGGNSGPVVSTQSFNVKIAVANDVALPHSYKFTGSGTLGGVSVTIAGTGDASVLTAATFEGQPALQQTQTTNLTATGNGTPVPLNSVTTLFYLPADYSPLGSTISNEYDVLDPGVTYPTAAKVGDTGMISTTKLYLDSTKATQVGNTIDTYSIEADTANSVIVNLVKASTFTQPAPATQTETIKYRLNALGTFTLLSDSVVSRTDSLTVMPVN